CLSVKGGGGPWFRARAGRPGAGGCPPPRRGPAKGPPKAGTAGAASREEAQTVKPAELKVLDRLDGKWRYEWESKPTEGDPKGSKGSGTSTNEWILDGWFQQRKGKGDNPLHEIVELWTYDVQTKTYRARGLMPPSPHHYEGTGAWDETSNTLSYKGKGPGDVTFVSTMRFIDKDNWEATRVARDAAGKLVQDTLFKLTRLK